MLGFLIVAITSTGNASGDGDENRTSCVSPCVPAPVVVCSSCPANKANNNDASKTAGDTTKAVMEAYKYFGEQVQNTYKKAIETVDLFAKLIGGFFIVAGGIIGIIGGILGFFGIKNYQQFKDSFEKSKKEFDKKMVSLDKATNDTARLTEDFQKQHGELSEQRTNLTEHIKEAKKNISGMLMVFMVHKRLSEAIELQGKAAGIIGESKKALQEKRVLELQKEAAFGEVKFRLENVDKKIQPKDLTVLAWAAALHGTMLHARGDLPGAINFYDKSLKLSEDDPDEYTAVSGTALYNKAGALVSQEKFQEAREQLQLAIQKMEFLAIAAMLDPEFDPLSDDPEFKSITGQEL